MLGEIYALLSAAGFGLAGAAVAKGAPTAKGDNGVFLSVLLTCTLAALIVLFRGVRLPAANGTTAIAAGVGFFIAAGIFANVFGRVTNFRAIAAAGAIRAGIFRRMIPVFSIVLAVLILGERYALPVVLGMALIVLSVVIAVWTRRRRQVPASAAPPMHWSAQGLIFGLLSAFCYGLAYVARKIAMVDVPDAALGALIGGLTGVVWYLVLAGFNAGFRQTVVSVFRNAGPWQWLAALGMSLGQVLLFYALLFAPVAVVAIIGSLEMFVGAFLAAYLFRSEPVPDRMTVIASGVALVGVVLVALG